MEVYKLKSCHIDEVFNINMLSLPNPWSKDSLIKELENKLGVYVVAVNKDMVIGFGGMWIILDEAHITNIAVHPDHRRKKAATLILKELINIAKEKNVEAMTLEVRKSNIKAQNLYKKFGFLVEGVRKGYYEDNKEDGLILWKRDIKEC